MDIRKLLDLRQPQTATATGIRRGMCWFACLLSVTILANGMAGPSAIVAAAPGAKTIDFTANKKSTVVSILGEVERCGAYRFPPGNVELLAVVRAAGGFKDTSAGTVRVLRNNRISEVLFGVNQSTSYQVQAGDLLIADQLHEHRPGLIEFPKPGVAMDGSKEFAKQRAPDIAIINLAEHPILFSPTRPGHTIWELLRGLQQRPEELRQVTILRHKVTPLTLDLTQPLPRSVTPEQLKLTHNMVVVLPTDTVNRGVINQLPAEMLKVTDVSLQGELLTGDAASNGELANESARIHNNNSNSAISQNAGNPKYGKPRLNVNDARNDGVEQNSAPNQYNGFGQNNGTGQFDNSQLPGDAAVMLDDRTPRGIASPGDSALNSPDVPSMNRGSEASPNQSGNASSGPMIRPQRPAAGLKSRRMTAAVPSPGSAAYPITEGLEPETPDVVDAPAIAHRPRDMHEQQYAAAGRDRLPPVPSDVVNLPAPGLRPSESQHNGEWGPVAMESQPQAGPVPFPGRDPALAAEQLTAENGSGMNTAQLAAPVDSESALHSMGESANDDAANATDTGLVQSEQDHLPGPKTAMLSRKSHSPIGSLPKAIAAATTGAATPDVELSAEAAGSATGGTGMRSNTLASILAPMGLMVIGSVLLFLHRRANRIGAETSNAAGIESRIIPLPTPVALSATLSTATTAANPATKSPASAKLPPQFAASATAAVSRSATANRTTAAAVAAAMSRPEVLHKSGTHWLTEQVALPLEMTFYGRANQGEALRVDPDHETPQPPQMNVLAGSLEPKSATSTRPATRTANGLASDTASAGQTAASRTDQPAEKPAGSHSNATATRSRTAGNSPLDRALMSVRGARS